MKLYTSDYQIDSSGTRDVTEQLQQLIDETASKKATLVIEKGIYLVSSLFLKSDMNLVLDTDSMLLATTNEEKYPILQTRVAGIEMAWYVGILNINNCENITISGSGSINGSGPYWWSKYWGEDQKSGMRGSYEAKGLRWAVDYDCMRVRNLVVLNSQNINICGVTSMYSGFWNIHILYSKHVLIKNIKIENGEVESPSTDGIDIDSSSFVTIEDCITSCHDDSICIKSGRDFDGYQIAKPCHDILVRNCEIRDGMGMTIGSEVSGGVYNIKFENIKFIGTDCGFRLKSSTARRGYIKNISFENIEMQNVKYPFNFNLNWNPKYSDCQLPTTYRGKVPIHWKKLLTKLDSDIKNTKVSNILIKNVKTLVSSDYTRGSRAFQITGFIDQPIENINFENISIKASEFGQISYAKNLIFKNVKIDISSENNESNNEYDNR